MDSWITVRQAHGQADYRARAIARKRNVTAHTCIGPQLRHVA
jgi:hypothetical protein